MQHGRVAPFGLLAGIILLAYAVVILRACQVNAQESDPKSLWIPPSPTLLPKLPAVAPTMPLRTTHRLSLAPERNRIYPLSAAQARADEKASDDDLLGDRELSKSDGLLNQTPTGPVPTTQDELPAPQRNRTPPGRYPLPGGNSPVDDSAQPRVPTASSQEMPLSVDPHVACFADNDFPSATTCAVCHKRIYDEWRVSSHAYSAISPMFHRFEQAVADLTRGTSGAFCIRCHAPVATTMGYPRHLPLVDGPPVFREGVTCVACHRVAERHGKVNGERRMEPGDIHAPVFGTIGGGGVMETVAQKDYFKVKVHGAEGGPGQKMHSQGIFFEQLSHSDFCASCHQVAVHPGIALEVVYAQYRASPAAKCGVNCQDCHMGRVPGVPAGYDLGPAAIMSGKVVNAHRKHSNHSFFGPGYSIAHPGIFPHHPKAQKWSVDAWMRFDYRAGWGSKEFEKQLAASPAHGFPPEWQSSDERMDAWEIIEENLQLLHKKKEQRKQVMENGLRVDGPAFVSERRAGKDLRFDYVVTNLNAGHNTPTGSLGAQPQLWLNVVLIAPNGMRVWESGYVDSLGDMADMHSLDVRAGRIRPDNQLFNLQTKFLINNVKGTDREMSLPVPVDVDPLPFLRPGNIPVSVLNHPPLIRMEAHSIAPLGRKTASYRIPGECLTIPGRYRLSSRMRNRAEPIYFMRFCKTTPDMERAMNEWMLDLHEYSVEFDVY